ncbi:MAG: plasmid stabilization protein [Chloroflexota bacterium]|nr:plasmid stabilization protein [Chloroflexota bacterium]
MATITVRNLDERLRQRLRLRAAQHGRSLEEEVHDILRATLGQEKAPVKNLGTALHELFKPFGGVELDIPPREPMREPPRFD